MHWLRDGLGPSLSVCAHNEEVTRGATARRGKRARRHHMRRLSCASLFTVLLLLTERGRGQWGGVYGPAPNGNYPSAGWAVEHYKNTAPSMTDGALRIQGNTRAYLVQDFQQAVWNEHKYVRFDLNHDALKFTLDLSQVPCGCLACVYMVKMKDPSNDESNYCDMAENTRPGLNDEECIELDILEANNWAMQTAIHTEQDGSYGSHNCDRNGCFARTGGPASPAQRQHSYGPNQYINSLRPFDVEARVDNIGALTIDLHQGGKSVTTFNRQIAGKRAGTTSLSPAQHTPCTHLDSRSLASRERKMRRPQVIHRILACRRQPCAPSRAHKASLRWSSPCGAPISSGSMVAATSASSRTPT